MKTLKNYMLFTLLALVGVVGLSSCESEEKMERRIIEGHCWQGSLPIYDEWGTDYYSRFFFEYDGTGVEEVYVNDHFNGEYPFEWGWMNDDYAVLMLKYHDRWGASYSCIDVMEVTHSELRGYFYENIDWYYEDRDNSFRNDRSDLYFRLRTSDAHRH